MKNLTLHRRLVPQTHQNYRDLHQQLDYWMNQLFWLYWMNQLLDYWMDLLLDHWMNQVLWNFLWKNFVQVQHAFFSFVTVSLQTFFPEFNKSTTDAVQFWGRFNTWFLSSEIPVPEKLFFLFSCKVFISSSAFFSKSGKYCFRIGPFYLFCQSWNTFLQVFLSVPKTAASNSRVWMTRAGIQIFRHFPHTVLLICKRGDCTSCYPSELLVLAVSLNKEKQHFQNSSQKEVGQTNHSSFCHTVHCLGHQPSKCHKDVRSYTQ